MNEEQANQTRRCGPEGCGGNSAGESERYCLASKCMAWRWDHDESLCVIEGTSLHPEIVNSVANAEKHDFKIIRRLDPTGHCGLAGQP